MKTSNKLSQIAFIITREFRAISTSYAVLLVLMGVFSCTDCFTTICMRPTS